MKIPGWLLEFRDFALRGNMVDLAIGVIIGTAFGKVVNSLVNDIIMPPIGLLLGGVDFSSFSINLKIPGSTKPPVEIKYGIFINSLISLFIISACIFVFIKVMNKLHHKKEESNTTDCPQCLMAIPIKAKKCGHCGSRISEVP